MVRNKWLRSVFLLPITTLLLSKHSLQLFCKHGLSIGHRALVDVVCMYTCTDLLWYSSPADCFCLPSPCCFRITFSASHIWRQDLDGEGWHWTPSQQGGRGCGVRKCAQCLYCHHCTTHLTMSEVVTTNRLMPKTFSTEVTSLFSRMTLLTEPDPTRPYIATGSADATNPVMFNDFLYLSAKLYVIFHPDVNPDVVITDIAHTTLDGQTAKCMQIF